jgi:hypothetical protein
VLHEINANSSLPSSPMQLRADGEGVGAIDGPAGFAVVLTLQSGDPIEVETVRDGRVSTLAVGESLLIRSRSQYRTVGISSWVRLSRHESDDSLRAQRFGVESRPTTAHPSPVHEPKRVA